jgi:uncharacterized FlaG/YvyC family protein
MEIKTGTVSTVDTTGQEGRYLETGTSFEYDFAITKPSVTVIPGQLVEVLHKTPSGRVVNVVRKIDGREV